MKCNRWTTALAGLGLISLTSILHAEEKAVPVLTAISSTTLSGFVDTSIMWKPGNGNGFIPGRAFDGGEGNAGGNKLDGFNLNVVKLALEKPLDESEWAAGYRVDLLFGPDAVAYNTSVNADAHSDFSVQQAYVAIRTPIGNGIDWKIGTWSTPLGYEVFESGNNPNYSRSYGWQLEDTQHTGILGTYTICPAVTISAGVANTYSPGINLRSPRAESHKAYMGSVTFTAPESFGSFKGATFSAGVIDGFGGNLEKDTVGVYAGTVLPMPITGLTLGAAFDYRFNGANAVTMASDSDSNWAWAAALYASFQATEKLKLNARADYTTGSDGTWYNGGISSVTDTNGVTTLVSDEQNELGSLTFTVDYSLWANVISRLEARWDHSLSGDQVYNDDSDKNAFTIALNLIYKF
jgi:hypothetical protein